MKKVLSDKFFARPAPVVAEDLLGKFLVRKVNGKEISSMIIETEAYEGVEDLASHASKGRTARTEVMFGPPGHIYIYLIYGMYFMLNIVTGKKEEPSAVLIRGTEEFSGPGKLTKGTLINKELNTLTASPKTGLWFEDRGVKIDKKEIETTPRIGVSYAGRIWAKKPWRFVYNTKSK